MKTILVLGAGTMGSGIAQNAAMAGYDVTLCDISEAALEKGRNAIQGSLARLCQKGTLEGGQAREVLRRIAYAATFSAAQPADLVIEAVGENLALKQRVFGELDALMSPETLFASNTSSISITALSAATKRPDKVCGLHFFQPVPLSSVVEIARALTTSDETFDALAQVARNMGKRAIQVQDSPGFVFNRLMMPMINEAAFVLSEGVASAEDIDATMCLASSFLIGPLKLADLIGLDVCEAIMQVLYHEFADDKYRVCPLIRKMVRAGRLGRKSGQGFYIYDKT